MNLQANAPTFYNTGTVGPFVSLNVFQNQGKGCLKNVRNRNIKVRKTMPAMLMIVLLYLGSA